MLRRVARMVGWGVVVGLLGVLVVSACMLGALICFLSYAGFF